MYALLEATRLLCLCVGVIFGVTAMTLCVGSWLVDESGFFK